MDTHFFSDTPTHVFWDTHLDPSAFPERNILPCTHPYANPGSDTDQQRHSDRYRVAYGHHNTVPAAYAHGDLDGSRGLKSDCDELISARNTDPERDNEPFEDGYTERDANGDSYGQPDRCGGAGDSHFNSRTCRLSLREPDVGCERYPNPESDALAIRERRADECPDGDRDAVADPHLHPRGDPDVYTESHDYPSSDTNSYAHPHGIFYEDTHCCGERHRDGDPQPLGKRDTHVGHPRTHRDRNRDTHSNGKRDAHAGRAESGCVRHAHGIPCRDRSADAHPRADTQTNRLGQPRGNVYETGDTHSDRDPWGCSFGECDPHGHVRGIPDCFTTHTGAADCNRHLWRERCDTHANARGECKPHPEPDAGGRGNGGTNPLTDRICDREFKSNRNAFSNCERHCVAIRHSHVDGLPLSYG